MEILTKLSPIFRLVLFLLTLPVFGLAQQFPVNNQKIVQGVGTTAQGISSYSSSPPTTAPTAATFRHVTSIHMDTVLQIQYIYKRPRWYPISVVRRATPPPATASSGSTTIDYTESIWQSTADSLTYYYEEENACWQPIGTYLSSTTPVDVAATGSTGAICYGYGLWYDPDVDSIYAQQGSTWTAIGAGGGTSGAVDSIAVLQDSIVVGYSLGVEVTRDTIGYPVPDIGDIPGLADSLAAAPSGTGTNQRIVVWTGTNSQGNSTQLQSAAGVTLDANLAYRITGGTTASRPTGAAGMMYWNTSNGWWDLHNGAAWFNPLRSATATGLGTSTHVGYFDGSGLMTGSSGFVYDAASVRVGIETTSPASKLEVQTNSLGTTQTNASGLLLSNNTPALLGALQISNAFRARGSAYDPVAGASKPVDFRQYVLPIQTAGSPTGTYLWQASINNGAYSNLMALTSGGNLGIGTTAPTADLDIVSDFSTTGFPLSVKNSGYYNAYFQGTDANDQASFYIENDRGLYASYAGFFYGGSTSTLANLFGRSRQDRLFMFADGASNAGMVVGTNTNDPLEFGTSATIRATILGTGEFGIGTATPALTLDVRSTSANTTGVFSLANTTVTTPLKQFATNATPQSAITGSPGDIAFNNGGSAWLKETGTATNTGWARFLTTTDGAGYLPLAGGTMAGNVLFTDNTYDIGASGLTRPRTGYFGTSVVSPIFNATTGFQIGGAAASGKILKANGTNFVASTETYAAPGSSGNIMTSDGTNWTSATPTAAVVNLSLTGTSQVIELTNSAGTDVVFKGVDIGLTKVSGTKDTLYLTKIEHWGEVSVSGGSTSVTAGTPERPDNDTPGTATGSVSSEFTQSGSTITYVGAAGVAELTASLSFAPTTGGDFLISIFQEGAEIAKSEVRVTTLIGAYETVTLSTVNVAVATNDTFDIRIEPTAGSDTITVHSCNIYARKVY